MKRLPAYFYRSETGREPVREWLKSLGPEDRKVIGEDIKEVEFSWGVASVSEVGAHIWHPPCSPEDLSAAYLVWLPGTSRKTLDFPTIPITVCHPTSGTRQRLDPVACGVARGDAWSTLYTGSS